MFKKDELVWAKSSVARQIYWPAKVIEFDRVLACHLRKPVIACVLFLVEQTHEAITDTKRLLPFDCEKKNTFLKKGRGLKDPFKRLQFDSAVNQAENQMQSRGRQCSPNMSPGKDGKSTDNISRTSPQKTPVTITPKDVKVPRSPSRELAVNKTDESTRVTSEKSIANIAEISQPPLGKGSKRTRGSSEGDIDSSRKHGRKNELADGTRSVKKKLSCKLKKKERGTSTRKTGIKSTNKKNIGKRNTNTTGRGEGDGNATRVGTSAVSDSTPNGLNGVSSSIPNEIREDSPGLSNTSGETLLDTMHETNKPMSNFVPKSMLKDDLETTVDQDKSEEKDGSVCNGQNNEDDNKNINLENSKNSSSDDEDECFPEAFSPSPGLECHDFRQGDVVWAKFRKYPYWPSQIDSEWMRKRKLTHYYVFFLPKGRRNPFKVRKSNLISFAHDLDTYERYKNQEIKSTERDEFDQALKEAEDILANRVSHKDSSFLPEDEDPSICSPINEKEDTNGFEEDEEFSEHKTEIKKVKCDSLIHPERRKSQRRKRSTSKYNEILLEFHRCKSRLVKIYHETFPSDRHQKFRYGTVAEKDHLKHQSGFGPVHDDDDIHEKIIGILTAWYKEVVEKTFFGLDYIFDVWLPEAIIFYIQNIENVSRKMAEVIFLDHDRNAAEEDVKAVTSWFEERKNKMDKQVMQEIEERSRQAFQLC